MQLREPARGHALEEGAKLRRTAVVLVLMVVAAALPVVRGLAKEASAGSAASPSVRADFDDDDFRRRTPAEANAIFADLGLTGPFWTLPG